MSRRVARVRVQFARVRVQIAHALQTPFELHHCTAWKVAFQLLEVPVLQRITIDASHTLASILADAPERSCGACFSAIGPSCSCCKTAYSDACPCPFWNHGCCSRCHHRRLHIYSHFEQLHCRFAPRMPPFLPISHPINPSLFTPPGSEVFRFAAAASRHRLDLRIFSRDRGLWSYAGTCAALRPRGRSDEVLARCLAHMLFALTFSYTTGVFPGSNASSAPPSTAAAPNAPA